MKWTYFEHEKAYELKLPMGYLFSKPSASFILDPVSKILSFFMRNASGTWEETETIQYYSDNNSIKIRKRLHDKLRVGVEIIDANSSRDISPYKKTLLNANGLDKESRGLVRLIFEKLDQLPKIK